MVRGCSIPFWMRGGIRILECATVQSPYSEPVRDARRKIQTRYLESLKTPSGSLATKVYELRIGDAEAIECMRVFDLESEPTDSDVLIEAYTSIVLVGRS